MIIIIIILQSASLFVTPQQNSISETEGWTLLRGLRVLK
jgi:hypothetical protein